MRTAGPVAIATSGVLNRTNALINHGWGVDYINDKDKDKEYKQRETKLTSQRWSPFIDEYINKETGALNKKGRAHLNNLYMNNQKFKDIINFVGDKAKLSNEYS